MKLSDPQIDAIGKGLEGALIAGLARNWPLAAIDLLGAAGVVITPALILEVGREAERLALAAIQGVGAGFAEWLKVNPPEMDPLNGGSVVVGDQGIGDGPAYDPTKGSV